jgi:hypothetical protein
MAVDLLGSFREKVPTFRPKAAKFSTKAVDFSPEDANNEPDVHNGAELTVQLCPNSAEQTSAVGHFAEKSGEFIDEGAIRRP